MISHRYVFVVWVERIVRVAPAPAIPSMMDAGKKIGEFADRGRQVEGALGCGVEQPPGNPFDPGSLGAVRGEQRRDPPAQGRPWPPPERHQRVQGRARGCFGRLRRLAGEQPRFERRGEIEDHIADCDAATLRSARRAEAPERQVLDWKLAVCLGRGDPAFPLCIVGFVDPAHRPSPACSLALLRLIILRFCCGRRDANDL